MTHSQVTLSQLNTYSLGRPGRPHKTETGYHFSNSSVPIPATGSRGKRIDRSRKSPLEVVQLGYHVALGSKEKFVRNKHSARGQLGCSSSVYDRQPLRKKNETSVSESLVQRYSIEQIRGGESSYFFTNKSVRKRYRNESAKHVHGTTPGRIGRPRRPLPAGGDVPEVRTTPGGIGRPRRPLPAGGDVPEVRTTPGRIGRPRRPLPAGGDVPEVRTTPAGSDIRGDTYLLREAPAGGFHRTGKTGCPSVQMNSRRQVTPIKEDRAYHYRRSAPMEFSIRACCQGTKKRKKKRQSGDATKGSKTTQVPNCYRMINSL